MLIIGVIKVIVIKVIVIKVIVIKAITKLVVLIKIIDKTMRVKQGNRLTPRLATVDIFFLHSQCEMLKTQCALHSSTLECIWRISFCTAWPIQNQENGIWRKRNDHFLTTLGRKFGHAC